MEQKASKITGDTIFFSIMIPVTAAVVWYSWGFAMLLPVFLVFAGMYCYYMLFLTIAFPENKGGDLRSSKTKSIVYAILSIVIFATGLWLFGLAFALETLAIPGVRIIFYLLFLRK